MSYLRLVYRNQENEPDPYKYSNLCEYVKFHKEEAE